MDVAHSVTVRVFCGQEENENEVVNGLKSLLPLDLEKEKIAINRQNALGFGDRKIAIFEVTLIKKRHIKAFLDNLLPKISATDKQTLLRQVGSRVDDDANFFARLEKETLAKRNELLVTDGGNCYHVRIKMAAYPSNKENAVKIIKNFLSGNKTEVEAA